MKSVITFFVILLLTLPFQLVRAEFPIELKNQTIVIDCETNSMPYDDSFNDDAFNFLVEWSRDFLYFPAEITFDQPYGHAWRVTCEYLDVLDGNVFTQKKNLKFPIETTKIISNDKHCIFYNKSCLFQIVKPKNSDVLWINTAYVENDSLTANIDDFLFEEVVKTDPFDIPFYKWKSYTVSVPNADKVYTQLVDLISEEYKQTRKVNDTDIASLIEFPLGIDWRDGWNNPGDVVLQTAKFYYNPTEHFGSYYISSPGITINGSKVSSIDISLRKSTSGKSYAVSTKYTIELPTIKQYKKEQKQQWNKTKIKLEECKWDKNSAIEYLNELISDLKDLGWELEKEKSKHAICIYKGIKGSKLIDLTLYYKHGKNYDFYYIPFYIFNRENY